MTLFINIKYGDVAVKSIPLPLKAPRNEQCSVIRFLWAKGLSANATHHTVQTGPQ